MASSELFRKAVLAIIQGDKSKLIQLLKEHPFLATETVELEGHRASLLHYVAANGVDDSFQKTPDNIMEIASLLFDKGADPHATASFYGGNAGSTALVGLVSSIHPYQKGLQAKLTQMFVDKGARVDGLNGDGLPLATALEFWYPQTASVLISNGARTDNVVFAAAAGSLEHVNKWIQLPDSISSPAHFPEPFDRTLTAQDEIVLAFIAAALCDQFAVVDHMLTQGFNIDSLSHRGHTALHVVSYRGSIAMLRHLIVSGASCMIRDGQWNSLPIHWAYSGDQEDSFQKLLQHTTLSPEDYAEFGMNEELVTYLSKYPDHVDGVQKDGLPLREAAFRGHLDTVRLLLESGADPSLKSKAGHTALHYALEQGHDDVAALLQKHSYI